MVQLDGGNTVIGTEFIELLNTGSSNLATESYVDTAVANGGGGGADLTDYYDKTETDNLLNNKLNINNPQDMSGTLRIGHVAGTSKIILNAVASDKDFYGGNMNVFSLDSTGHIQGANVSVSDDVKTNAIDSYGISDVTLKRNTFDICYLKNGSLELNAGIDLVAPAQVQANTYNSFDDSSVLLLRNGAEFMRFGKTEDDILVSKDIEGTNLKVSGGITTNSISSDGNNDIVFTRNSIDLLSIKENEVEINNNNNFVCHNQVKSSIYNSYGDENTTFRRYGDDYLIFNSNPAPVAIPLVQVPDGKGFEADKIFMNEIRSRSLNANMRFMEVIVQVMIELILCNGQEQMRT